MSPPISETPRIAQRRRETHAVHGSGRALASILSAAA
jgi:hypothetical protein